MLVGVVINDGFLGAAAGGGDARCRSTQVDHNLLHSLGTLLTITHIALSRAHIIGVSGDKDLDAEFVKKAEAAGLVSLKGHRTVGGMRASIYNAMPEEGVDALIAFMKKFEEEHTA